MLCVLTSSLAKHLLPLFFLLPPQCGLQGLEGARGLWKCSPELLGIPRSTQKVASSRQPSQVGEELVGSHTAYSLPSSLASQYLAWLLHVIPFFNPCSDLGISGTGVNLVREDGFSP